MKRVIVSGIVKLVVIISSFFWGSYNSFSQQQDSLKKSIRINGMISVTNNGFSFIPAFTLDKPAAFAFITVEKKRLSFNTELRYALTGRPWAVAFISRYKLINTSKAQISTGIQFPAISFLQTSVMQDSNEKEIIEAQQSITPEVNTNFRLSKNISAGTTYLYYHGIGKVVPKRGQYFSLNASVGDIKVSKALRFSFDSQFFYLKVDHSDGFFTAWNFVLSKDKFPITFSSMMSKTITSNIGGKDFNWNLSLNYVFGGKYLKH